MRVSPSKPIGGRNRMQKYMRWSAILVVLMLGLSAYYLRTLLRTEAS